MRLSIPLVCCFVILSGLFASDLTAKPPEAKKQTKQTPAQQTAPAATAKPADSKPEQPADKKKPAGETPTVHKVTEGPLKVEVSLKGVFEAESAQEMVLRPESWKNFEVIKAVDPGTAVKKGDVLVQFDPRDLDNAIRDLSTSQRSAELSLKQAEENLRALESTTPLDLEAVGRAKRIADEDLDRFRKIQRPLSEKMADHLLKTAEDALRNEREELAQLEKMYKADDLTEETEEIVLKRQRDAVRRAEFYLEVVKTHRNQSRQVTIPREAELVQQAAARQHIATAKAGIVIPLALSQQRLEVERMKLERTKSQERLKKLSADRSLMTLRAPADGVVYYGQCVRGKWTGAESVAKNLRRGATVPANDVLITIVKPRPLVVRASVPEKQLRLIRPGDAGTVEATAYPGKMFDATVAKVHNIPFGDEFDVQFSIELPRIAKLLMPGMSCTVKLIPYQKRNALAVPAAAVFAEPWDDQKQFVYLVADGGKWKKRRVTVGEKVGERVEILKGLVAGDSILLERPKSEKP